MIVFHDLLKKLSANGWSAARLQRERQISNGTIIRIRAGMSVSTETINTICRLCHCQPGDLMSYKPDPEEGEKA